MDEAMSVSVADMVISDLTTMYGNEPTFDSGKIAVIVNKVIEEVIQARKYRDRGYSDERIESEEEAKEKLKHIMEQIDDISWTGFVIKSAIKEWEEI